MKRRLSARNTLNTVGLQNYRFQKIWIKIGAKVIWHAQYVVFQMAEVAIPRGLFRAILERIHRLRFSEVVPK
ncbi:MAG: hypothetical protein HZA50_03660 [Planctomycetes bacterium]|nr:hypothetical protein [Planctomycetota bacterium]